MDFIQKYDRSQRQSRLPPDVKNDVHSISVSPQVQKQVGLDLSSLPEIDSHLHLIVCSDYFTKWLEANPIRKKTKVQIND